MAEHWDASFLVSKSEFKFPASSILLESLFQFTVALHLRIRCDRSEAVHTPLDASFGNSSSASFTHYNSVPNRVALVSGIPLPDSTHKEHTTELF